MCIHPATAVLKGLQTRLAAASGVDPQPACLPPADERIALDRDAVCKCCLEIGGINTAYVSACYDVKWRLAHISVSAWSGIGRQRFSLPAALVGRELRPAAANRVDAAPPAENLHRSMQAAALICIW